MGRLNSYNETVELNANWIAGLKQYPSGKNRELFGRQLCEAFLHYFDQKL
jgi:hypothetical protein